MNRLLEMFEEDNGRLSSIRILNFLIVISIMIKMIKTGTPPSYEEVAILVAALGLKVSQKKNEKPAKCEE